MYITHRMHETFPFQTMWNGRAFAVIDIMRNEYVDEYVCEDVALAQVKALNTKFHIEQHAKIQAYWAIERAKERDRSSSNVFASLWTRLIGALRPYFRNLHGT